MGALFDALLCGDSGALKRNFVESIRERNRFSRYLPMRYFDPQTQLYHNVDASLGQVFECQPLVYAGQKVFNYLENLLNQPFEQDTIIQFILYADPNIDLFLEDFQNLKNDHNELSFMAAENFAKFLGAGTRGLDKLKGIPLRNFRLFACLKSPCKANQQLFVDDCNTTYEALKGAELYPRRLDPEGLINLLGKLFNHRLPHMPYDENQEIHEQILTSETQIEPQFDKLVIGDNLWKCISVKKFPEYINEMSFNYLSGDYEGVTGDTNQITTPFWLCVNVIFQDVAGKLHSKCNIALQQKFVGSWGTKLRNMQDEYLWATGEIEKQTKFVKVMPIVWFWDQTAKGLEKGEARIKKVWAGRSKFTVQADKGILTPMLLSALPFGLYTDKNNVDFLNRHFICHSRIAAKCLPIQSDFKGGGNPISLFVGRKGQLATLDLFDKRSRNFNAVVCATSGAGKSFFLGSLLWNYSTTGVKIRIIDLGGSYKRMCKIRGGKFLQFDKKSEISLNPFTHIRDINDSIKTLSTIIAQMVFSATSMAPTEDQMTLIKGAIKSVWEHCGSDGNIDRVYETLAQPKYIEELYQFDCGDDSCVADLKKVSTSLAFNLQAFTSDGEYGKWFNKPATLDFEKENLVVLELDELKAIPELFRVVVLQLVDNMTSEMYVGEKGTKKIVVFEEAWQYFEKRSNTSSEEVQFFAQVINEGYRRARKYGGSFITVTQSLLDFLAFGDIATAILSNSEFKFFLMSKDYAKAVKEKLIDYGEFGLHILNTIDSPRPLYSEIFAHTPMGVGPMRLVVDPFMYYLLTTDADDVAAIDALVGRGMSYEDAIRHQIEQSRA